MHVEGSFFFDPEDRIYTDHFPGNPVVPGSVIIHAFMLAANKLCTERKVASISSFRFKKFISPGEYPFHIELSGRDIKCSLFSSKSLVATGRLGL